MARYMLFGSFVSNMSAVLLCFLLMNSAWCYAYDIVTEPEENFDPKYPMQNQVCRTPGCIKAAQYILDHMDKTVNPCDNFYQFACGKYLEDTSIEDDDTYASETDEIEYKLQKQLKESIEEKIEKKDPRALQLLKSHYNVCLNLTNIEETSTEILLDVLNKLGGWPVIVGETWNESTFDWKILMYQLRQMGYEDSMDSFIDFEIDFDINNNSRHNIYLYEALLGLEQDYLVEGKDNHVVQDYYTYMVQVAKTLGADLHQAKKELEKSLNFEIQLAKIADAAAKRSDDSEMYKSITVEELQLTYPFIPWIEYLNEFSQPRFRIESSDEVIVKNPYIFKFLSKLIAETPKRTLANYAIWRVVQESAPFMNKQIVDLKDKYEGSNEHYDRWQTCVSHVSDYLPIAVGALYVRKNFDRSLKSHVAELVNDLRESFQNLLRKANWMDKKTKRIAVRKLKSIYAHVAYPDELLDDVKLDRYFKNLKEVPESYLDSYLSIKRFQFDYSLQKFTKPINKTDWIRHANSASFNAYYRLEENSILVYGAYLPVEYYSETRPNYMNYGAIGSIIGHELTHGFDVNGSQYDEEGRLINWWYPKTYKKFLQQTQCISDQYKNYTVAKIGSNLYGEKTEGENIADNGGVKQAYFAYEEYEKRNGPEPRLPGLPYSSRQMFWISMANIYCEKYGPEAFKDQIMNNNHSPGEFRVNGPLSNIPQFAEDFQCPLESFMNPSKKCTVW